MKARTLIAPAEERLIITRPLYLVIPISGVLLFLSFTVGLVLLNLIGFIGWISVVVIFAAVLIASLANRAKRENKVHNYEVSYTDNRDIGGEVNMQYVDLETSRQTAIAVSKLTMYPKKPLWSSMGPTSIVYYSGTVCSLRISPKKGNYDLIIGFPSVDEMKKFWEELGGEKGLTNA